MIFDDARAIVQSGLESHAYPAAAIEVGRVSGPIWWEAFGRLTYAKDAPLCRPETIFDLASLTKVIATASITMQHIAGGRLSLETLVREVCAQHEASRETAYADVTIRQLLDHSSGLPAHVRFWQTASSRSELAQALSALDLESSPGSKALYSDPGFLLLGFILEQVGRAPLDAQFAPIASHLTDRIEFRPAAALRDRIAPTEDDPWRGRVLRGEVHDENAAILDGVAGHAGLFGTAGAVGAFARIVLATFSEPTWLGTPALMTTFATRSHVPGSSRALGWDTMLPTSSCGALMSPTAIGHTGFTGTSLWIDWERDLYAVFLTNRVHPTRENEQLAALRPKVHDAIMKGIEQT